jgi:hypothetical protein
MNYSRRPEPFVLAKRKLPHKQKASCFFVLGQISLMPSDVLKDDFLFR